MPPEGVHPATAALGRAADAQQDMLRKTNAADEADRAARRAAADGTPPEDDDVAEGKELPPGFKKVNIIKTFTLTMPDHTKLRVFQGVRFLPDDVADHWYTRAHSDDPAPVVMRPGMAGYVEQQQRKLATERVIEAAIEQTAEEQRNATRDALKKKIGTGSKKSVFQ
jgi:hypothetical protein